MLRFEIEGNWEPEDFIEVLKGTESLYYKLALARLPFRRPFYHFEPPGPFLSYEENLGFSNDLALHQARVTSDSSQRLGVRRLTYASPGAIDLIGLGEAFKAIEGIVDRLLKFFEGRNVRRERDKQTEIETERLRVRADRDRESLRALKVKNARSVLQLMRDFPEMSEEYLVALIAHDQDRLIPRISEGKITGIRNLDTKG